MDLDFIYNPHATSLKAISLFAGAGGEMSIFINKYIYPPINDIEQSMTSQLGKIQLELRDSQLTVNNGTDEYVINRN